MALKYKKFYFNSDTVFVFINSFLLALIFLVTIYPILFVVSASVSDPLLVSSGKVLLLPKGLTIQGYEYVVRYRELWIGYANTVFYTVAGTLLNLIFTLPCAYALSRRDFPARTIIMTFFIITMYVSGGLIPHYLNVSSFGLVNTRAVLLILGLVSVYNLIVARTFFANTIPWELQEAARIDGYSDFGIFFKIILPLSSPIVVVLAMYYGVGHWNEYFQAMIYLKDRGLYPLQLFLREILIQTQMLSVMGSGLSTEEIDYILKQQDNANLLKYGVIVVSTAPMLIVYPWLQKYFAKGVMLGSVKG
ncbi:MAG: carbohydrate ABC transporter permease [Treponema sp.]|nr:carbohydrate ABC transporter permease [Treponema sp.]